MNGVHDMGGMEGLGAIQPEPNEPVFHERWEARVHALVLAIGAWRKWNIDASRHARERIPAVDYLRMTYYEKWLAALVEQMIAAGLVTRAEVESGNPATESTKATPPLAAEMVPAVLAKGRPVNRTVPEAPRFNTGQTVRTRNIHPKGHTRLPRYARGKQGLIERVHGAHVFPDSNAHFLGEAPQHLYSVRIEARELWGEAAGNREAVYLDLWDNYLDPI